MSIHRLNHAVLFVRNIERSVEFYRDVLDFEVLDGLERVRSAAFLRAPGSSNDHDLGLFALGDDAAASAAGRGAVGLYHLAWEVDTLQDLVELRTRLAAAGALVGASDHGTTKSLYAHDPDGLEFEVAWVVPLDRLDDPALAARMQIGRLDLEAEIARYGANTPGGIGISRPAVAPISG